MATTLVCGSVVPMTCYTHMYPRAADVVPRFAALGYACPSLDNPASYVIDVLVESEYDGVGKARETLIRDNKDYHNDAANRVDLTGPNVFAQHAGAKV